jgi:aminoglycoside phosphotransferase (APT) family kinase protein
MEDIRDSMVSIDQPKDVRKGEELDVAVLSTYLEQVNPEWVGELAIHQFSGGYSNLTYNIQVGGHDIILRRPPFGANVKSGHDMEREYTVQHLLKPHFDAVAPVYHLCKDHDIMGCDFYIMQRVQGVILRAKGLGDAGLPEDYQQISATWLKTLVDLHQVDYEMAGLSDLGKPEGYTRRQIEGWTRRYTKAQTHDHASATAVMQWLNKSIPNCADHSLIHNDFKYDNVMFAPNDWSRIKAILDWEMATIGNPVMDFATSLAYWAEEEDLAVFGPLISQPTHQAGNPDRTGLIEMYGAQSGRDMSDIVYHYVYGLFKIAVIIQQIYYRFHHGHTDDPRFAQLDQAVRGFCFKAQRAIEKNRVSQLFG